MDWLYSPYWNYFYIALYSIAAVLMVASRSSGMWVVGFAGIFAPWIVSLVWYQDTHMLQAIYPGTVMIGIIVSIAWWGISPHLRHYGLVVGILCFVVLALRANHAPTVIVNAVALLKLITFVAYALNQSIARVELQKTKGNSYFSFYKSATHP